MFSILFVFKFIVFLGGLIIVKILVFENFILVFFGNGGSYGGFGGGDINYFFYGNILYFIDYGLIGGGIY